jgi:transcriptional regulator of acetoin/glycerol metabolism
MTYTPIPSTALANAQPRLATIRQARRAVLYGEFAQGAPSAGLESWIENSWRRCLANGQQPGQQPVFGMVAEAALRRTLDANHLLVQSARPVLEKLGRAIANTRYFAILTNQHGIVVDAGGAIDRSDRRADLITRVGTDLSESQLATTAIGAALKELQPVWLHRGEHFFEANAAYSCAGAPLFGPNGNCVGMLDLTGIEAAERPELKHLVSQAARSIENALTLGRLAGPHHHQGMLVRLNWPGRTLGDETDGLVCVDADGWVLGANQTARQMLPQINQPGPSPGPNPPQHCSELFAMDFELLFDATRQYAGAASQSLEVPLWSGLRLQALTQKPGQNQPVAQKNPPVQPAPAQPGASLKDVEIALIHKAVNDARGNVMQAARALGISRATIYRRLGNGKR